MMSERVEQVLAMDRSELVSKWIEIIGCPPPRRLSRGMIAKVLASELQWEASGRSRAQVLKSLQRVLAASEKDKPIADAGKRLVREWNGHEHIVDVTRDGYIWRGRTWRSLSAIAREITGARWSGPRFFGVEA